MAARPAAGILGWPVARFRGLVGSMARRNAMRNPRRTSSQVGVTFTASRCDGYALTESKKTFVFPAWIHLDGGPATKVELRAEGELRALLEGFLEQYLANPLGS